MCIEIEVWKSIIEYEGFYSVSNHGQIKRHALKIKCAKGYRTARERIRKLGKDKDGYSNVVLVKLGKCKTYRVARLVAQAFIPNPNNKPQVNHIDSIKSNDFSINLEWVTNSENIIHTHATGLRKGELPHYSKITQQEADTIREEYSSNKSTKTELAIKYRLCRRSIGRIINMNVWNKKLLNKEN